MTLTSTQSDPEYNCLCLPNKKYVYMYCSLTYWPFTRKSKWLQEQKILHMNASNKKYAHMYCSLTYWPFTRKSTWLQEINILHINALQKSTRTCIVPWPTDLLQVSQDGVKKLLHMNASQLQYLTYKVIYAMQCRQFYKLLDKWIIWRRLNSILLLSLGRVYI